MYDAYTQGSIRIFANGDKWYGCDNIAQTPGKIVGETTIGAPGPFAFDAHISSNVESPPQILLTARALGASTDPWACEAGATAILAPADHAGITLTLVPGPCPGFK